MLLSTYLTMQIILGMIFCISVGLLFLMRQNRHPLAFYVSIIMMGIAGISCLFLTFTVILGPR